MPGWGGTGFFDKAAKIKLLRNWVPSKRTFLAAHWLKGRDIRFSTGRQTSTSNGEKRGSFQQKSEVETDLHSTPPKGMIISQRGASGNDKTTERKKLICRAHCGGQDRPLRFARMVKVTPQWKTGRND